MSGPMLAVGALVVLCCSSTSAALMMMTGGDETPTSPGPTGPATVDILYDEKTMPYPASGHTELGAATSVAACRTLARAGNHTNFGFRKSTQPGEYANTCWAFNNSAELNGKTPENIANHVVGCVDPSKDITKGCV